VFGHSSSNPDASDSLECLVYDLPSYNMDNVSRADAGYLLPDNLDSLEWGPLVARSSCTSESVRDLYMEAWEVPQASEKTLAFLLEGDSAVYLLRFNLSPNPCLKPNYILPVAIPLPDNASVRLVGVGSSGRRAVWLERNFDTAHSRLMKLDSGCDKPTGSGASEGILSGVLLPPGPGPLLPFLIDTCQALAFDEVSCRVCIGLEDGKLYVVDYI
jgi:hypothetical protein